MPIGGATAGFCLLLMLGVQRWRPTLDADRKPAAPLAAGLTRLLRLVLGDPRLCRLALASISFTMAQFCFTAFSVTFVARQAGMELIAAGSILSIALATSVGARLAWGWLADRSSARTASASPWRHSLWWRP